MPCLSSGLGFRICKCRGFGVWGPCLTTRGLAEETPWRRLSDLKGKARLNPKV